MACAGFTPGASLDHDPRIDPIDDMSEQDWDKTHDINLKGVFLTVIACWAKMKEHTAGLY